MRQVTKPKPEVCRGCRYLRASFAPHGLGGWYCRTHPRGMFERLNCGYEPTFWERLRRWLCAD